MSNESDQENGKVSVRVKDKELHRVVTTTVVYRPDFTYLVTKRSLSKKV